MTLRERERGGQLSLLDAGAANLAAKYKITFPAPVGRTLDIDGDIKPETLEGIKHAIVEACARSQERDFTLRICTNGGDVDVALEFVDWIEYIHPEIHLTTVGYGRVFSGGIVLFALGNTRYCTENTLFLHHDTELDLDENDKKLTLTNVNRWKSELEVTHERLHRHLERKTGTKASEWRSMLPETYLSPEEALNINLTHYILRTVRKSDNTDPLP